MIPRRAFLLGLAAPALARATSLDFIPKAPKRFNPHVDVAKWSDFNMTGVYSCGADISNAPDFCGYMIMEARGGVARVRARWT